MGRFGLRAVAAAALAAVALAVAGPAAASDVSLAQVTVAWLQKMQGPADKLDKVDPATDPKGAMTALQQVFVYSAAAAQAVGREQPTSTAGVRFSKLAQSAFDAFALGAQQYIVYLPKMLAAHRTIDATKVPFDKGYKLLQVGGALLQQAASLAPQLQKQAASTQAPSASSVPAGGAGGGYVAAVKSSLVRVMPLVVQLKNIPVSTENQQKLVSTASAIVANVNASVAALNAAHPTGAAAQANQLLQKGLASYAAAAQVVAKVSDALEPDPFPHETQMYDPVSNSFYMVNDCGCDAYEIGRRIRQKLDKINADSAQYTAQGTQLIQQALGILAKG